VIPVKVLRKNCAFFGKAAKSLYGLPIGLESGWQGLEHGWVARKAQQRLFGSAE
jgi:hypothetical protein